MPNIYLIKILILTGLSFTTAFLLTPMLTHYLYKYKMGKAIRNTGATPVFSALHEHKAGTPTMGGILIWFTTLILALFFFYVDYFFPSSTLGFLNFLTRPETILPLSCLVATALAAWIALNLAGCGKPSETVTPPAPEITVGAQVDDAVITSGIKSALVSDPLVKGFDLQVETRKGVVQLSGFVDSRAQIDRALALARAVPGVTEVENSVSLKGKPSTAATKIDDATVTGRVKTALLADPDIRSFDISVLTHKSVVQLTGFVNSQAQIDRAVRIAAATEGASSVKNGLLIKQ